ncbi:hypothetical protein HPULCUR_002424 [Helicostylum pulchrum]|uniref:Uncharacterized protein n=1 Tax=Helicostylum pulchrum TaxID=562976 RepID=A0ABP9XQF5_9FUNG
MERFLKAYVPPKKRMETLATNIANNVKYTFAYGVFVFTNIICSEKKHIENYFCPKKTGSFNEYYIDECDMGDDECDDEDEYYCIDEYGTDNDEYDSDISSTATCIDEDEYCYIDEYEK